MDKNKKTYKSHIVLVKQLIKPYCFKTQEGKQVKFYNVKTNQIEQDKLNSLDVETEYFDSTTEECLDKYVESPFADTVLKLEKMMDSNLTEGITLKDLDVIRRFFQFSILRNKEFFKKILNESAFSSLMQGFSPSIMLAFSNVTNSKFKNKRISIIRNITSKDYGFVCPHNVVYYFKNPFHKLFDLAITINTKTILCLNLEQECDYIDIIELNNELDVRAINCAAYLVEKNHSVEYIVGKENDLKRLIDDIKEIEL